MAEDYQRIDESAFTGEEEYIEFELRSEAGELITTIRATPDEYAQWDAVRAKQKVGWDEFFATALADFAEKQSREANEKPTS